MSELHLTTPIIVAIVIGVGATVAVLSLIMAPNSGYDFRKQLSGGNNDQQSPYPSIEIEMSKTSYLVGERLNFTINTFGLCATPNVIITRNDDAQAGMVLTVFQYMALPTHCGSNPDVKSGLPHFIWTADRLQQKFSNEYVGGDGKSVINTSAALILKKAGNYTVSASLINRQMTVSQDFAVRERAFSSHTDEVGKTADIPMSISHADAALLRDIALADSRVRQLMNGRGYSVLGYDFVGEGNNTRASYPEIHFIIGNESEIAVVVDLKSNRVLDIETFSLGYY